MQEEQQRRLDLVQVHAELAQDGLRAGRGEWQHDGGAVRGVPAGRLGDGLGHDVAEPAAVARVEADVVVARVDLGRRGELEDALEADALVADVARVARLLGRLAHRADGEHVPLGEARLVVLEDDLLAPRDDAQRRHHARRVGVVVGVLHELEHKVHVARVELGREPVDRAHQPILQVAQRAAYLGRLGGAVEADAVLCGDARADLATRGTVPSGAMGVHVGRRLCWLCLLAGVGRLRFGSRQAAVGHGWEQRRGGR